VFDFLWKEKNAWIIKGDFSSFFDTLNHQLLLKTVKQVLLGDVDLKLQDDWYSILKFVTKYRTISKKEIDALYKPFHGKTYVDNRKKLGNYIKTGKLHLSSTNNKGIPQGTAISAVLANVYMIFFDEYVDRLVKSYGGFYRRYSDDFVIILPESKCDYACVNEIKSRIISKSENELFLDIETKKTKLLHFVKGERKIYKNNTSTATTFDYLGFEFNGKTVFLRSKTLYKFHYRGKKGIILLARNLEERTIVESDHYPRLRKKYLLRRIKSKHIEKIKEGLDCAKKDSEAGQSIKGRRKATIMYLSSKPRKMKNMLNYAVNAQKVFSIPISGCDSLYYVNIEKKIKKQIGFFQREFNKLKKKHNKELQEINVNVK
ncbi:reverse transcriptase/maturase family protein, partial [Sporolactobacillus inulinus]